MFNFVFLSILEKSILFSYMLLFSSAQINKIIPYWCNPAWIACGSRSDSPYGWDKIKLKRTVAFHSNHYPQQPLPRRDVGEKGENWVHFTHKLKRTREENCLPLESTPSPRKKGEWGREGFSSWTVGLFIHHHIWVTKERKVTADVGCTDALYWWLCYGGTDCSQWKQVDSILVICQPS